MIELVREVYLFLHYSRIATFLVDFDRFVGIDAGAVVVA